MNLDVGARIVKWQSAEPGASSCVFQTDTCGLGLAKPCGADVTLHVLDIRLGATELNVFQRGFLPCFDLIFP